MIKTVHKRISSGINYHMNVPGQYRTHVVKVGDLAHGGIWTPPRIYQDVQHTMEEAAKWLNSPAVIELGWSVRACLAHYHLALIHPFGDGNGRTARLIEALLLKTGGLRWTAALSNYCYRHMDAYFWAFSRSIKSHNKDVTAFVSFFFEGLVESLAEIKDRAMWFVRKFALRDYYAFLRQKRSITKRQHELLGVLLESPQLVVTHSTLRTIPQTAPMYSGVTLRTASRDLFKLKKQNLVLPGDDGYRLNWHALDSVP